MLSKNDIQDIYLKLTGKLMSSTYLDAWYEKLGKNIETTDALVSWVTKTSDYVECKLVDMKKLYYLHIGYNIPDDVIKEFRDYVEGKKVSNAEIYKFLANTNVFYDMLMPRVATMYENLTGLLASEHVDEVTNYFERFKADDTYTLDTLEHDIKAKLIENGAKVSNNVETQSRNNDIKVLADTDNKETKVVEHVVHVKPVLNKKDLVTFGDVFRRPMYVEEYFKYVIDWSGDKAPDYRQIFDKHVKSYNKLRQIVETFQSEPFTEHDYITLYLDDVEKPGFFDTIVDRIIQTPNYKASMMEQISKVYNSLFATELRAQEIEYIFALSQSKKYSLYDDKLHTVLVTFKTDTDNAAEHINNVFMNTLDRNPDEYELANYCDVYRRDMSNNVSITTCDAQLQSLLIKSFEFHDVIKTMLKDEYQNSTGKRIPPSLLFNTLQKVCDQVRDVDNLSAVCEIVKKHVKDLEN